LTQIKQIALMQLVALQLSIQTGFDRESILMIIKAFVIMRALISGISM
jgi:hypothetical protein